MHSAPNAGNVVAVIAGVPEELMVKVAVLLVEGEAPVVSTVTLAVPAVRMSAAVMAAVNCVALTNVVVRGLPFQFTVLFPDR